MISTRRVFVVLSILHCNLIGSSFGAFIYSTSLNKSGANFANQDKEKQWQWAAEHPQLQDAITRELLVQPLGWPNVYILGTVHIGSQSAKEAETLIHVIQPNRVVLEMPSSRLERRERERRQQRLQKQKQQDRTETGIINNFTPQNSSSSSTTKTKSFGEALQTLPALATMGYEKGGISGLLFSVIIIGGSLVKQSIVKKDESEILPRRNEFTAAMEAAQEINDNCGTTDEGEVTTQIIAADLELEDLIKSFVRSMSILRWIELGLNIMIESVGIKDPDPVRRMRGETLLDWEDRRRNIATARSSKAHGEGYAGGVLGSVLVDERDARFVDACLKATTSGENLNGNRTSSEVSIVCIVGLVHLDGVVQGLERQGGGVKLEQSN
uniref:TraB domain-containing protein n=1 Tax=Chaetoceros debilis TaxID=122233 RepID=A0A7S3VGT0_9STRA|mmetsp:Transcript_22062/g.33532  ORF Transcript_22062/g.33532 Transcript_22062/m.33532 type:complete len:383 (+) Transcript_22062:123-1271(+)|eukprot:CAMPEP_0194111202 /NCGR_PEP_ID=MMETSP0150-20130528/10258_1 /TAXON_ID=122233 /ORGANISM="Chaetoceros debilis, Strain MM31A-1" /LENGTH=382 /DNA_ID=CAMNT_0038800575 /DNA_START=37 /DNA_END=1185 /DNA_ORIENTATION=+